MRDTQTRYLLLSIQTDNKDEFKTPADSIAVPRFEFMHLNEEKRQQNLIAANMIYEALLQDQKIDSKIQRTTNPADKKTSHPKLPSRKHSPTKLSPVKHLS
jgi:hypothetical protein